MSSNRENNRGKEVVFVAKDYNEDVKPFTTDVITDSRAQLTDKLPTPGSQPVIVEEVFDLMEAYREFLGKLTDENRIYIMDIEGDPIGYMLDMPNAIAEKIYERLIRVIDEFSETFESSVDPRRILSCIGEFGVVVHEGEVLDVDLWPSEDEDLDLDCDLEEQDEDDGAGELLN